MTLSAKDQQLDANDSGMLFVKERFVDELDRLWVLVVLEKIMRLYEWLMVITGAVSLGFNNTRELDALLLDQLRIVGVGVQSMRRRWLVLLLFSHPGALQGHSCAGLCLVQCLGQADYNKALLLCRLSRTGNARVWLFYHLRRVSDLLRRLGRAVIFC
jgi:hypothetical protein